MGDVHGDAAAFEHAVEGAEAAGLFLIQLGDLTDGGPDSPDVLRRMFALLETRRGRFLLGNHDHKLRRALDGQRVRMTAEGLGRTLAQLAAAPDGPALTARAIAEIGTAPAWLRLGPAALRPRRLAPADAAGALPAAGRGTRSRIRCCRGRCSAR